MPQVQYDNAAAVFFTSSLLICFVVPATFYIITRLTTFKAVKPDPEAAAKVRRGGATCAFMCWPAHAADAHVLSPVTPVSLSQNARTRAEAAQLRAREAAKPVQTVWAPWFRIFVGVTIAAAVVAAVLLAIGGPSSSLAGYDPFAVLDLPETASEAEIKSAYRKLSRIHHPDVGGSAEMFQKISKAYETLTDAEQRANWLKYGNPDGQRPLQISVSMFSWMGQGIGGYLFLALYMGVLVAAVPYVMCRFYRRNRNKDVSTGMHVGSLPWLMNRARGGPMWMAQEILPETIAALPDTSELVMSAEDSGPLATIQALVQKEEMMPPMPALGDKSPQARWLPDQLVARNLLLLMGYLTRLDVTHPMSLSHTYIAARNTLLGYAEKALALLLELGLSFEFDFANQRAAAKTKDPKASIAAPQYITGIETLLIFSRRVRRPARGWQRRLRLLVCARGCVAIAACVRDCEPTIALLLPHAPQLVQALWMPVAKLKTANEETEALRQVFKREAVEAMSTSRDRRITSLKQLLAMPKEDRTVVTALPAEERREVEALLDSLPRLTVRQPPCCAAARTPHQRALVLTVVCR